MINVKKYFKIAGDVVVDAAHLRSQGDSRIGSCSPGWCSSHAAHGGLSISEEWGILGNVLTTDQARVGETLVKLMVAKGPRVAGPTEALKAAWEVAADAVVADVLLIALVHVFGAGGSSVTIGTGAPVR